VDVDGVGLLEILENYFLSSHNLSADADSSQTVMQLVESLSVEECLKASRQVVSCLGAIVEQLSKVRNDLVFHSEFIFVAEMHLWHLGRLFLFIVSSIGLLRIGFFKIS